MSEPLETTKNYECLFCGTCFSDSVKMVIRKDKEDTAICSNCIMNCESVLRGEEEEEEEKERFRRMPPRPRPQPGDKLRSISRIPKGWHVYDVELFEKEPYARACSSTGKKIADFSLPLPLAVWMMSNDDKLDIEEIREKIIDRINMAVWGAINNCK